MSCDGHGDRTDCETCTPPDQLLMCPHECAADQLHVHRAHHPAPFTTATDALPCPGSRAGGNCDRPERHATTMSVAELGEMVANDPHPRRVPVVEDGDTCPSCGAKPGDRQCPGPDICGPSVWEHCPASCPDPYHERNPGPALDTPACAVDLTGVEPGQSLTIDHAGCPGDAPCRADEQPVAPVPDGYEVVTYDPALYAVELFATADDAELYAIGALGKLLGRLDPDERHRVLVYLNDRWSTT